MTEKLYAIIHEADGDTIWRWQSGRKARFVEYGGYHKAKELAEAAGSVLALWGSQYGHRGVPGDAGEADIRAAVESAIERRDTHACGPSTATRRRPRAAHGPTGRRASVGLPLARCGSEQGRVALQQLGVAAGALAGREGLGIVGLLLQLAQRREDLGPPLGACPLLALRAPHRAPVRAVVVGEQGRRGHPGTVANASAVAAAAPQPGWHEGRRNATLAAARGGAPASPAVAAVG